MSETARELKAWASTQGFAISSMRRNGLPRAPCLMARRDRHRTIGLDFMSAGFPAQHGEGRNGIFPKLPRPPIQRLPACLAAPRSVITSRSIAGFLVLKVTLPAPMHREDSRVSPA